MVRLRFTEFILVGSFYISRETDSPAQSTADYIYDNKCKYFIKGRPSEGFKKELLKMKKLI